MSCRVQDYSEIVDGQWTTIDEMDRCKSFAIWLNPCGDQCSLRPHFPIISLPLLFFELNKLSILLNIRQQCGSCGYACK